MAASSRAQVLDLYRAMLRESKHFSAYNYRMYAVRRIRDAFRENKNVKNPVEIQALVNKAKRDLEIIRRQGTEQVFRATSFSTVYQQVNGEQWSGNTMKRLPSEGKNSDTSYKMSEPENTMPREIQQSQRAHTMCILANCIRLTS
ncbi:LYR motif-containing protein 4 isoform X1 [Peromyscus eremicus]|uniref:LYR motif-containing protein 4 isoform X1 n=1 Tax=Peromyscus eremicus TaxID=42410 RepID=UPI0027DD2F4A|nr:LYR motif-containing protein 4 isoform X1 [Peromyscus eremicus]